MAFVRRVSVPGCGDCGGPIEVEVISALAVSGAKYCAVCGALALARMRVLERAQAEANWQMSKVALARLLIAKSDLLDEEVDAIIQRYSPAEERLARE